MPKPKSAKAANNVITTGIASPASPIFHSIYLGPCSATSAITYLSSQGITHILSIGATPPIQHLHITYMRLSLSDSPSSSISQTVDAATVFINGIPEGQKVLVHCSAAISRSPTIVTAYLMKAHHMTLHDALGKIICTRPTTSPNPGFIRQLKEMERELFDDASTLDVDELPRRKEDRAAMFTEQEKSQTTAKVNVQ